MNQVKELKQKQEQELKTTIDSYLESLKQSEDYKRLKGELESFENDPYSREYRLYIDGSGMLNSTMELGLGDLASEEPETLDALFESLCEFGYFEQDQYSQGPREWRVSQCLGEPVFYNVSPKRGHYAIYSTELNLKIGSVISEEHGFALIEQAMRQDGVFETIVSTDYYYGTPTLLSNPLRNLTDQELKDLIDSIENKENN